MTLFDAMQADHCWRIPDGSEDLPFTQGYLDDCMRTRRKRMAMWQQKSADECRIDFIVAQVKKAEMGRKSRCSPGLEKEIADFGERDRAYSLIRDRCFHPGCAGSEL